MNGSGPHQVRFPRHVDTLLVLRIVMGHNTQLGAVNTCGEKTAVLLHF